jgi:cell division protein ZapA
MAESTANTIEINVYGTTYRVKSDETPDYVKQVADRIDREMKEIGENSNIPVSQCAVLAAMNISDELHKLKSENEKLKSILDRINSEVDEKLETLDD